MAGADSTPIPAAPSCKLRPECFDRSERQRLRAIREDPRLVARLEDIRRDYAVATNNSAVLVMDEHSRREVPQDGVGWALSQPRRDKLPTEADVRKMMSRLAKQADSLLETINACGGFEASVLSKKGIRPLIEQIGERHGLDVGSLVRLLPLLEYLQQAATLASQADDYGKSVFPRDHKKRNVLQALWAIAEVFGQFGLTVSDYRPNDFYDTKSAEGGPFWKAAVIALTQAPSHEA